MELKIGLHPHLNALATSVLSLTFGVLILAIFLVVKNSGAKKQNLQFQADGTFKVVIFSDLHFGENAWTSWGPEQDVNSTAAIEKILDKETPDFVVLLGDQLTSNNVVGNNASLYWSQITSPIRKRSIPYSSILGNHDTAPFEWPASWFGEKGVPQPIPSTEGSACRKAESKSRSSLIDFDSRAGSLTGKGPDSLWPAAGNYHLKVHSPGVKSPALLLYFLDSGGGDTPQVLSAAQREWLRATMQAENRPQTVPEILFLHIPLTAMAAAAPAKGQPVTAPCRGQLSDDNVTPVQSDWGLSDFLASRTAVKAVFAGHDHGNDWCCPYSHMWLCYARHSGYGGYGTWKRGARVLEFTLTAAGAGLHSWVRFEDGMKFSHGKLF